MALALSTVATAACLITPQAARAGWPLDGGASVALGFGASYAAADGTSATHRGVDLAAEAGSPVHSPVAGRVTFVGKVPGRAGGTVLAVTIAGESGTITLLPLASAGVQAGTDLAEGATVGDLAAMGDESTRDAHLHVGARRGDLYIDPLSVIAPPPAPVTETPAPPPAPVDVVQPHASGHAADVPVQVPGAVVVSAPAGGGVTVQKPAGAPAARANAAATVLTPGAAVAPGVEIAGAVDAASLGDSTIGAATAALSARVRQGIEGSAGTSSMAALERWARGAVTRSLVVGGRLLAAVLLALGALWPVWRRERQKEPSQLSVRPIDDDVAAVAGQW